VVSPEQRATALTDWNATLRQQLNATRDEAPERVAEDTEALARLVHDLMTFGSFTAAEEDEAVTVDDVPDDDYQLAECPHEHVEATGVDFAYEGLPKSLPPGVVAFTFTNQGEEPHQLFLARLDDDVPMSPEQVMALAEDQLCSMTTPVGRSAVLPGLSETTFIRLGRPTTPSGWWRLSSSGDAAGSGRAEQRQHHAVDQLDSECLVQAFPGDEPALDDDARAGLGLQGCAHRG
jgi:hypothetical protein